ncbi:MAG: class I SAM-dependent methyltransferase [Sulfuritalea sp.]|nr:class I SAM-dependent methyltransferase [Sulfuritalea sp.]
MKQYIRNKTEKIRLVPALLAVVVQFTALLMIIISTKLIFLVGHAYFYTVLSFPILLLVIMQALFASLFSYWLGMASWWRLIHFSFPVIIWLMSQWQVPSEIYLTGFVFSLGLFWTTFRSQVPFFPSRPIVWQQLARLIPQDRPIRLIDIGSGLGDVAMHIAKIRADSLIEGVEVAPLPWLISYVRAKLRRSTAIFKMGDYRALNFANYDVVFAYLSPVAMPALWQKASQEMKSGSLLISLEFEVPGIAPNLRIAGAKNSPMIYVWKLP